MDMAAQRDKQDPIVVELPGQVLGHDVLVHGGPPVKAQATLLQVGDELLLRGWHLVGIRADQKIAQKFAVHRHTVGLVKRHETS